MRPLSSYNWRAIIRNALVSAPSRIKSIRGIPPFSWVFGAIALAFFVVLCAAVLVTAPIYWLMVSLAPPKVSEWLTLPDD